MGFNPNIPLPTDNLSVSQGDLKLNFQTSNASFGIDHYAFDDGTVNNGKHNKVSTPLISGGVAPVTTTDPIFYAMQDSANLGVIQYSRGPSNAVPSPVTNLQSGSAAIVIGSGSISNVFDYTGLSRSMSMIYAFDTTSSTANRVIAYVYWNGTNLFVNPLTPSTPLISSLLPQASGNILILRNSSGSSMNVYWTLQFLRTQ